MSSLNCSSVSDAVSLAIGTESPPNPLIWTHPTDEPACGLQWCEQQPPGQPSAVYAAESAATAADAAADALPLHGYPPTAHPDQRRVLLRVAGVPVTMATERSIVRDVEYAGMYIHMYMYLLVHCTGYLS